MFDEIDIRESTPHVEEVFVKKVDISDNGMNHVYFVENSQEQCLDWMTLDQLFKKFPDLSSETQQRIKSTFNRIKGNELTPASDTFIQDSISDALEDYIYTAVEENLNDLWHLGKETIEIPEDLLVDASDEELNGLVLQAATTAAFSNFLNQEDNPTFHISRINNKFTITLEF